MMAPITKRLYAEAFVRLWNWVGTHPPDAVSSSAAYDRLLSAFIESQWESGATRGDAGNALSASIKMYPQLRGRGQLPGSWYLLNAWRWYEIPIRAPPMPVELLLALAWYFVRERHIGGALVLLIGYDSFLRTGEMTGMAIDDLKFAPDGTGVIRLEHTKTGQRNAAFEASTINDPICGQVYRAFKRSLPSNTHGQNYVFRAKLHKFYSLFEAGLRWLGADGYCFKPYSVRRGGATAFFRATRNMEATLDRGRWASARVARIYVNDGLAREVELRFPAELSERLRHYGAALRHWLRTS
jgi:integrase